MEPTLGTNEQRSHDYLNYCEYPAYGVDPFGFPEVFTRERVDACEWTSRGVADVYRGYNRGVKLVMEDHDFIGTSQTTRDICSRTADALSIISLFLSLSFSLSPEAGTRSHDPARVCALHVTGERTWESKNLATAKSVRKFIRCRICVGSRHCCNYENFAFGERCCIKCANHRFRRCRATVRRNAIIGRD